MGEVCKRTFRESTIEEEEVLGKEDREKVELNEAEGSSAFGNKMG